MEATVPAEADETPLRRPRVTEARKMELLNVVMDLLGEVSYEELSMDLVAARGRCSKATLYRLWPTKPQLVVAALYAMNPLRPEHVDTGTLRGDLLAVVDLLAANGKAMTGLFAALGHAVLTDDELSHAVRTSLLEPWFADLVGFIDRAVERGELAARPPGVHFLPEVLLSVTLTHPLFTRDLADTDYLTKCVDQVLMPLLLTAAP
jgi:AcrR family transcriptional regulator